MPEETPLELVLVVDDGPGLKVALRNRSGTSCKYCYSMFWQPPIIELTGPDGAIIKGQDRRVIMRPLDPIGSEAFYELGPGGVDDLLEAGIERSREDGYTIRLGHLSFHGLRPGTYSVVATMECTRESWADENRKWHLEENVWKGDLRSKEVKIKLP